MESGGGRILEGKLAELRKALEDYFGALNEIKFGHPALKVKIPEKPAALKKWQTCQVLNLPFMPGGLVDQPYLWLLEVQLIKEVEAEYKALDALNTQQ